MNHVPAAVHILRARSPRAPPREKRQRKRREERQERNRAENDQHARDRFADRLALLRDRVRGANPLCRAENEKDLDGADREELARDDEQRSDDDEYDHGQLAHAIEVRGHDERAEDERDGSEVLHASIIDR